MKPLTILVTDDHEIVRHGLCSLLQSHAAWKTVEASNGSEAIAKVRELHPDIVILDIDMPELNGLEAAKQILKKMPDLPVVLLSAYCTEAMIEKALEAGIRGYVLKTDSTEALSAALEAVLHGRVFFTGAISRRLLGYLPRSHAQHLRSTLTLREYEWNAQLLKTVKSGIQIRRNSQKWNYS